MTDFNSFDLDLISLSERSIKLLTDKINASKHKILLDRLSELHIEFDFNEYKSRRFKLLERVIDGSTETIYYNDGSINGLRIVTFTENQTLSPPDNPSSISYTYKYH